MPPEAPPLPDRLRDEVRVNWYMTQWCNYSCQYCPVLVYHKRTKSGQPQPHAFDYYPVEKWLEAFDTLEASKIHTHLTGGEPFLDRQNLLALLEGLVRRNIGVCISTNGAWDPEYFRDLDKRNIFLDIGFHPSQTDLAALLRQIERIREGGFRIAVVNYVVSPENIDVFDEAYEALSANGQYVQVSAMFPTGVHLSRDYRTGRELEILVRHNTPLDLHYKLIWPTMERRLCFYPTLNYQMYWDGTVQVSCMDESQNVFEAGFPPLPRQAVPCPRYQCIGCTDMYRSLVDEPLYDQPFQIFTHEDLAREVSAYRRTVRAKMPREEILAEAARWREKLGGLREEFYDKLPTVPADAIKPALPEGQAVVGYVDVVDNRFYIQARSRDRVMVTGWLASAEHGAPLREVKLRVGGAEVGSIREFYPRPDVAAHFGRQNWLMSGWRTMIFMPSLKAGEHQLIVEGIDPEGKSATIPPWPVRIVD